MKKLIAVSAVAALAATALSAEVTLGDVPSGLQLQTLIQQQKTKA